MAISEVERLRLFGFCEVQKQRSSEILIRRL